MCVYVFEAFHSSRCWEFFHPSCCVVCSLGDATRCMLWCVAAIMIPPCVHRIFEARLFNPRRRRVCPTANSSSTTLCSTFSESTRRGDCYRLHNKISPFSAPPLTAVSAVWGNRVCCLKVNRNLFKRGGGGLARGVCEHVLMYQCHGYLS